MTRRSQTGPYQFSFGLTDPDKVEHFTFQDGLLVWMVDETYTDNNNSEHPGHGLALPVDARPAPFPIANGAMPSNRRQPFDATFGLQAVPAGPTVDPEPGIGPVALRGSAHAGHRREGEGPVRRVPMCLADGSPARGDTSFHDTDVDAYWDATNPQNSTKVADYGTKITVTGQNTGGTLSLTVDNSPTP